MKNLISIIFIIGAGALFFVFTNPRYETVKELRAEEATFDDALDRSKELIALRDELLAKYNAIPTADLEKINKLLPDSVDTVRLIIEINAIASRHSMTLLNISVGDVGASKDSSGRLGPASAAYEKVSLSFTVNATYEAFRAFLADLERNLRLLDVVTISFGESRPGASVTEYNVTFDTYWMK